MFPYNTILRSALVVENIYGKICINIFKLRVLSMWFYFFLIEYQNIKYLIVSDHDAKAMMMMMMPRLLIYTYRLVCVATILYNLYVHCTYYVPYIPSQHCHWGVICN